MANQAWVATQEVSSLVRLEAAAMTSMAEESAAVEVKEATVATEAMKAGWGRSSWH